MRNPCPLPTYANEILQIAVHNAKRIDVEWSMRSHYHHQKHTLNGTRIFIPFGQINHITQIDQIRVQHLAKVEEEKQHYQIVHDGYDWHLHHLKYRCSIVLSSKMKQFPKKINLSFHLSTGGMS